MQHSRNGSPHLRCARLLRTPSRSRGSAPLGRCHMYAGWLMMVATRAVKNSFCYLVSVVETDCGFLSRSFWGSLPGPEEFFDPSLHMGKALHTGLPNTCTEYVGPSDSSSSHLCICWKTSSQGRLPSPYATGPLALPVTTPINRCSPHHKKQERNTCFKQSLKWVCQFLRVPFGFCLGSPILRQSRIFRKSAPRAAPKDELKLPHVS